MEENKQKNSRRRLNSLILLVAFTAIMLIVSTYAWFSTQRNVSISNLEGTVKVAEGLEISLDASTWSQEIDFSQYTPEQLRNVYHSASEHNIVPSELLPVSSNGAEGITKTEIPFYRGTNENKIELNTIKAVDGLGSTATPTDKNTTTYPGYYAIDLFLRNNSNVTTEEQGKATETLQLSSGSTVSIKTGGAESTGLQNTPRIAFAMYKDTATVTAGQADVISATTGEGKTIKDVAIWEPNANDHVQTIVTNYNSSSNINIGPIRWKQADVTGYLTDKGTEEKIKQPGQETETTTGAYIAAYTATETLPTYALTAESVTAGNIKNLYNWGGAANASLKKQISLQTTKGATATVKNLISVNSPEAAIYTKSPTGKVEEFQMLKNTIIRLRMYVWLEGQDPDCVNYASHGGGIELDFGLCKGEEIAAEGQG